jgi:hypothetical protein
MQRVPDRQHDSARITGQPEVFHLHDDYLAKRKWIASDVRAGSRRDKGRLRTKHPRCGSMRNVAVITDKM